MKLRDSRQVKTPDLMIIPMIDIMFFLLVFFMISTMYMVDLKTIPIKLISGDSTKGWAYMEELKERANAEGWILEPTSQNPGSEGFVAPKVGA